MLCFTHYALTSLSFLSLAEQCRCYPHLRKAFANNTVLIYRSSPLHIALPLRNSTVLFHRLIISPLTFATPEQFAPQQFQLYSQLIYRYSHHCYTLPYHSLSQHHFSDLMLFCVMHCLCISLTFDAFAFPFLTIQSLCWSFSASRFLCFASLLNATAELNNSCTMPCISLSNLRYTIPLLKSTLLFRCHSSGS